MGWVAVLFIAMVGVLVFVLNELHQIKANSIDVTGMSEEDKGCLETIKEGFNRLSKR